MSKDEKHTVFEKVGNYKVLRDRDDKFINPFLKLYIGAQSSDVPITGTQFTFFINHATTVHKLLGRTVDHLYIANWS